MNLNTHQRHLNLHGTKTQIKEMNKKVAQKENFIRTKKTFNNSNKNQM
jgi:hypothetical protein